MYARNEVDGDILGGATEIGFGWRSRRRLANSSRSRGGLGMGAKRLGFKFAVIRLDITVISDRILFPSFAKAPLARSSMPHESKFA